jgi:CAAX prenyl protease-like protein
VSIRPRVHNQPTWTSYTLNSLRYNTDSHLFKQIQLIGEVMSLFSRGASASSNLTYCTPVSIRPLPRNLTLTLAKIPPLSCSLRQYPLFSKSSPPAVLADHFTSQAFEKSQKYGKHKAKFSIVSGLYKQFIDTLQLASCFYYPWAWRASGQLLGLTGYGSEYLVCPQEVAPRAGV